MEQIFQFALTVIVISASGVMAPGPLFAANVSYGLRGGTKSGLKMAIGHTIVELPLVILLGVGVFSLEIFPDFRNIISILGAITLFFFAFIQIQTTLRKNKSILSKPETTSGFYRHDLGNSHLSGDFQINNDEVIVSGMNLKTQRSNISLNVSARNDLEVLVKGGILPGKTCTV